MVRYDNNCTRHIPGMYPINKCFLYIFFQLDNELRTQQARHGALCEEKMRLEEDLGSSKSAHRQAEIQLEKLQVCGLDMYVLM